MVWVAISFLNNNGQQGCFFDLAQCKSFLLAGFSHWLLCLVPLLLRLLLLRLLQLRLLQPTATTTTTNRRLDSFPRLFCVVSNALSLPPTPSLPPHPHLLVAVIVVVVIVVTVLVIIVIMVVVLQYQSILTLCSTTNMNISDSDSNLDDPCSSSAMEL